MENLDAAVQERIDGDTEFQTSLADLPDEERDAKLAEKRTEVTNVIFKELSEGKTKAEQIAEDQRKRAEKAEREKAGKTKKDGAGDGGEPNELPAPTDRLSDEDLYALRHADIHPEDVPEIKKAAKVLGVSIPDALKDDMVKSMIAKRVEHRKTGNATDPGSPNGGPKRRTDAEVLADFNAGKIPEPGTPEAEQLYRIRRGIAGKK